MKSLYIIYDLWFNMKYLERWFLNEDSRNFNRGKEVSSRE